MNFRKLLAFVLVFSLATQPGSVRFSYAEDTKAAKVKFEKKTEASDELAIEINESELDEYLFDPGSREQKLEEAAPVAAEETAKTSKISCALAGAIAAGVAAATAVVGTAGLMIYNGVSNKDEIAKLWTSEEGSFFSHLGKTISILFKGANEASNEPVEGPTLAEEEKTEDPVEQQIQVEEKTQPTGIDSVDESLCDEVKLGKEYGDKLAEKLTDKEQESVSEEHESTEQSETESEQRVDNDVQEETTEEPAPAEEERTKNLVEEQAQSEEKAEESVEGPTLAEEEKTEDPVEEPAPAEEEKTEDPVEHQIQVEEKTQPTGIDSVDKSLCDEAKLSVEGTTSTDDAEAYKEKERLAKKEAERKAKEEAERVAKEEAERKAKEEAERVAKEEAERKAKEEAERLAKEEAERKAKEEAERLAEEERNTKIISHSQKRSNWVYELVQNKIKLKRQTDRVQPQIDVLKEEDRGEFQEELNKIKDVIEKATSVKGLEGQLTTLANEVAKAEAAQQREMQNQLETIESQDEKQVGNNVQQDNNEESSTGEKPKTKALDNLDSQIKEIISGFGELNKSYVEKETKKYVANFEELQNMHDTDTAVEKLKQIKEDLQTKLDKLKKACQNNPKSCGKE